MNQMVDVWKELPDATDQEASANLESLSSTKGGFFLFLFLPFNSLR